MKFSASLWHTPVFRQVCGLKIAFAVFLLCTVLREILRYSWLFGRRSFRCARPCLSSASAWFADIRRPRCRPSWPPTQTCCPPKTSLPGPVSERFASRLCAGRVLMIASLQVQRPQAAHCAAASRPGSCYSDSAGRTPLWSHRLWRHSDGF